MGFPFRLRAVWACVLAALFCLDAFCGGPDLKPVSRAAVVRSVIDGDTVQIQNGERVRLIGINAPEYEPWRNLEEPYGREAALFLKRLLTGKKIFLESDSEKKDKYGRTLSYAYFEDGRFINRLLVSEGYARARYYRPNGRYYQLLKEAEGEAKAGKKGLWAAGGPSKSGLEKFRARV